MKKSSLLVSTSSFAAAVMISTAAFSASTLPVGPFRSLELRGGGHVILRHGAAQRIKLIDGSTQVTRFRVKSDGQLVIDACNKDCPRHYNLEVEIVTPRIEGVAIAGGGKLESESGFGRQDSIGAAIEGGGHIDIRSIDAEHVDAAVDGGGHIALRAERSLEAAVDGGGNISYWGNPSVTSAVNGGGSVNKGG